MKCNQFRQIERNKRSSALVGDTGLNTKHPRQTVGKGAFIVGLLVGQFESSWTARFGLDSGAQVESTKSLEESSAKLSSSGISLQASPMAREKTTSMHNREIKRIGPVIPFLAIATEDSGGRGSNPIIPGDRRSRYELAFPRFGIRDRPEIGLSNHEARRLPIKATETVVKKLDLVSCKLEQAPSTDRRIYHLQVSPCANQGDTQPSAGFVG